MDLLLIAQFLKLLEVLFAMIPRDGEHVSGEWVYVYSGLFQVRETLEKMAARA